MERTRFEDESMWLLLRVVVAVGEGNEAYTAIPEPEPDLCAMERAGWLWLLPRGNRYLIVPTTEGTHALRRWSGRQAKDAARHFGRAA